MSFQISGYQNKLKQEIQGYSNSLISIQSNPSSTSGIKGSLFGSTGISGAAIQDAKNTDIFSAAAKYGGNTTTASQSNNNQNTVSNSTSQFMTFVSQVKNDAAAKLKSVIEQLQAKLDSTPTEQSAMTSPQTSGQTVNPQDNMPTDNQGGEKKTAGGEDNQKPNVGFGEETVTDKKEVDDTEKKEEPQKTENNNSVFNAESTSELDKAAEKESEKQLQEAQQKTLEEAKRLNIFTAASNAEAA